MKSLRLLSVLLTFLALPALACGLTGSGTNDTSATPTDAAVVEVPESLPTDRPAPEPTALAEPETTTASRPEPADSQARPTPDASASPSPTTSARPELLLSDTPYTHPTGAFTLVPPAGWTIEESSGSTSFDAPEGTGFIYVQMTNTGYELGGNAFAAFVSYRDFNFFDDFDGYEVINEELDTDSGTATVFKFLNYNDVTQTVITFYYQYGPIIYTFDFWSDHDFFDAYDALYSDVLDTADVDPEAALNQAEYLWVYTFTGPNDLFIIEVPTAWQYERTESEATIVDTFTAPDGHAVIQNITYDEGSAISRTEAGTLALELLHSFYAPDIQILDDQVQADGSERLIWQSPGGDYSGISFLETRGTTFLLLTTMYDNEFEDVYIDTLEYTISSYTIPE